MSRRVPALARLACVVACAVLLDWRDVPAAAQPAAARALLDIGAAREIAPGIRLHHVTAPALVEPPAPISAWILRVGAPAEVRPALANDEVMGTETVAAIAARHRAAAAINAGFFHPNGDPWGLYKLRGHLVSDTRRLRGAVGIVGDGSAQRLIFDRVGASVSLVVKPRAGAGAATVEIAGVDTIRQRGKLMLFTPAYHAHTDTAPGGSEWAIGGKPLRVISGPHTGGKTRIPRDGFVLSYGSRSPPPALRRLRAAVRVDLETTYTVESGSAAEWQRARHIIGGAGLLAREGVFVDDWRVEGFAKGFADVRHPRTMIGTREDGSTWLVAVDGRQPDLSVGMTLLELRRLAERLGLRNALNFDGGGSTTMWVAGEVVNSPSDAAGPRMVGDALLVLARPPRS